MFCKCSSSGKEKGDCNQADVFCWVLVYLLFYKKRIQLTSYAPFLIRFLQLSLCFYLGIVFSVEAVLLIYLTNLLISISFSYVCLTYSYTYIIMKLVLASLALFTTGISAFSSIKPKNSNVRALSTNSALSMASGGKVSVQSGQDQLHPRH